MIMKKLVILLLAIVTFAIAYLERQTVGLPHVGNVVFDITSLYVPLGVVIFVTGSRIIQRRKLKEILWSLVAGVVAVLCSMVWMQLTMFTGEIVDRLDDETLLLFTFLNLIYILFVPIASIGIYIYSISNER